MIATSSRRVFSIVGATGLLLATLLTHPAASTVQGNASEPAETPITRSSLREGTRQFVSQASLDLANSPSLSEARAIWNDDSAFVDQVDYQLDFRSSTDYLSTDPAHLAQILVDRPDNHGSKELLLYMTDEEASELLRRYEVGDRMSDIVEAISGVDNTSAPEGTRLTYLSLIHI